jgi:hypothetical protein
LPPAGFVLLLAGDGAAVPSIQTSETLIVANQDQTVSPISRLSELFRLENQLRTQVGGTISVPLFS